MATGEAALPRLYTQSPAITLRQVEPAHVRVRIYFQQL